MVGSQSEIEDIADSDAALPESTKTVRFSRVDIHMFKAPDEPDTESDDDGGGDLEADGIVARPCEPICAS